MKKHHITPPEKGALKEIAADLFWARFPLPFRLNHINLYMLDTEDGWVLIDTGVDSPDTASYWQALLDGPLAGQRIDKLIATHHHVDHIGYAGPLAALTGARFYMSRAEYDHASWLYNLSTEAFNLKMAETYQRYGMAAEHIEHVRTGGSRYRQYVSALPEVNILEAGDKIHTKEGCFEVRLDAGHSDHQISLIDNERGLFIAVDYLLPRISPNISADIRNPDTDRLSSYLDYLSEMRDLPDGLQILPGHDWPFSGGGARAAELIAHHEMRLNQLLEAAQAKALHVADAMDVLFGRVFGPHELYFASGEARAHLTHLMHKKMMKREQRADLTEYFHLV